MFDIVIVGDSLVFLFLVFGLGKINIEFYLRPEKRGKINIGIWYLCTLMQAFSSRNVGLLRFFLKKFNVHEP